MKWTNYIFNIKEFNIFIVHDFGIEELEKDIKSLGLSKKRSQILKDLSKMIIEKYEGNLPPRAEDLTQVNGIADYVSKAYACVGLNNRTLFFDVNIKRIVERVFNDFDPSKKIKDEIEKKLDKLLPDTECKYFYWALLDFASVVCTKKSPKCEFCVISSWCYYNKHK
ncbi:MAG: hypothetical protein ACFE8P_16385 [Promethearchaeota archaeon]